MAVLGVHVLRSLLQLPKYLDQHGFSRPKRSHDSFKCQLIVIFRRIDLEIFTCKNFMDKIRLSILNEYFYIGKWFMNKEDFCFSNLGWVRKVYMILLWLSTLALVGVGLSKALSGERDGFPLVGYLFLFILIIGFSAWQHFTIVKRKSIQLGVIAVLSLLSGNVLSFIALLIFADVSRKEELALIASK